MNSCNIPPFFLPVFCNLEFLRTDNPQILPLLYTYIVDEAEFSFSLRFYASDGFKEFSYPNKMSHLLNDEQPHSGFICTLWIHDESLKEDVICNPDRIPAEIMADGRLARMAAYNSTISVHNTRHKATYAHKKKLSLELQELESSQIVEEQKRHECNESVTLTVDKETGRTENRRINREDSFLFSPSRATADMKMKQAALQVNMR